MIIFVIVVICVLLAFITTKGQKNPKRYYEKLDQFEGRIRAAIDLDELNSVIIECKTFVEKEAWNKYYAAEARRVLYYAYGKRAGMSGKELS
jgi:hypothetical protein